MAPHRMIEALAAARRYAQAVLGCAVIGVAACDSPVATEASTTAIGEVPPASLLEAQAQNLDDYGQITYVRTYVSGYEAGAVTHTDANAAMRHEMEVLVSVDQQIPTPYRRTFVTYVPRKQWQSTITLSFLCDAHTTVRASTEHTAWFPINTAYGISYSTVYECGNPSGGGDPQDPGGVGGGGGANCSTEYVVVEAYNEETGQWEVIWEGYAQVCE